MKRPNAMKHNSLSSTLRGGKTGVVVGLTAIAFLAGAFAIASAHPHKFGRTIELKKGAFLGVQMQALTDELRDGLDIKTEKGVLINEVIDESPADKAGLHDGDVIVAFNGKEVETPSQLSDLVAESKSGDEVKIEVMRDGRSKTFDVTIGDWPQDDMAFFAPQHFDFDIDMPAMLANFRPRRLGVQVSELDKDLASYFGVKKDDGVLVLSVVEESTAAAAGVKAGDIITKVGEDDVASTKDIRHALSDLDEGDKVKIEVVRKKRRKTLEGEVKGTSFDWKTSGFRRGHAPRGLHGRALVLEGDRGLREEIDELRKELEELREEIRK